MISNFVMDVILKGGFHAPIPEKTGMHVVIAGVDTYVVYGATDPTFSAAFFVDNSNSSKGLTEGNLKEVEKFFHQHDVPFSIIVSAHLSESTKEVLLLNGYSRLVELSCMMLTLPESLKRADIQTRIRRVVPSKSLETQAHLYELAYPMPRVDADIMVKTLEDLGFQSFVAFAEESEEPVAVGTLCVFVQGIETVAYLGGAATLPTARGQGAYSALLQHRLLRCHELGCRTVVVQANRETSMPSCIRAGFKEILEISLFVKQETMR